MSKIFSLDSSDEDVEDENVVEMIREGEKGEVR